MLGELIQGAFAARGISASTDTSEAIFRTLISILDNTGCEPQNRCSGHVVPNLNPNPHRLLALSCASRAWGLGSDIWWLVGARAVHEPGAHKLTLNPPLRIALRPVARAVHEPGAHSNKILLRIL